MGVTLNYVDHRRAAVEWNNSSWSLGFVGGLLILFAGIFDMLDGR